MAYHHPVMLNECIEGLNIRPGGIYLDGTMGGAGHAMAVISELAQGGHLIGIDRDKDAIDNALRVFHGHEQQVSLVLGNFKDSLMILKNLGFEKINGALLDLGVSSHQLDEPSRGFSYMQDAPLDMRMNKGEGKSAYHVVNNYDEFQLREIISSYGEERWAARIAEFIVNARKEKPISTTFQLVSVIKAAIPKGAREDGPHPAKRTFQAIRIEVNGELEILEKSIIDLTESLESGGRLCIITFHSLEDRIVKTAFNDLANPCKCPRDIPYCVCGKKPVVKVITRRPIVPSEQELEFNPRARSAKLRILEKL